MKKTLLLLVIALGFSSLGVAQEVADHAIGIRIGVDSDGVGPEANYQHGLSNNNRLEFGLAYHGDSYLNTTKITGLYHWVWAIDNGFNWYAGPGAGLGIANHKYKNYPYSGRKKKSDLFGYVTGAVGIEYKFDFPLLLSFDFRPQFNFGHVDDISYDFGVSARYVF